MTDASVVGSLRRLRDQIQPSIPSVPSKASRIEWNYRSGLSGGVDCFGWIFEYVLENRYE